MAAQFKVNVTLMFVFILVIEYCSAQQQNNLIDQNANTIFDRSFQNTLLSRQPINTMQTDGGTRLRANMGIGQTNNVRNNGFLQRINSPNQLSNNARITMLRITNPARPTGVGQTRTLQTPGRTGSAQLPGIQRGVNPTAGITRRRQLGVRPTSPLRTQTSNRRITVVRPSSGTRQLGNNQPRQTNIRGTGTSQLAGRLGNRQGQRTAQQNRQGALTRDPRTGLVVQGSQTRSRQGVSNMRPLGRVPTCRTNTVYACQPFPQNLDRRRARRCVNTCGSRLCAQLCLCGCVPQRTSGQSSRRINTDQLQSIRGQGRGTVSGGIRRNNGAMTGRSPNNLNFTIDNSVLTSLLANPDLNMLVGPEGINQLLRGEPPTLFGPQLQGRARQNRTVVNNNTMASINMGVPIPSGMTQTPLGSAPFLASMLASGGGERLQEIGSEIRTELFPSLTEFRRPGANMMSSLTNNNPGARPTSQVSSLDANFLGAILAMPNPIYISRDPPISLDATNVVVNPSLFDSGVMEPVIRFNPSRNRIRALRRQAQVLENAFDGNIPFETISDVLSGGNAGSGVLRTSGNQEPSDVDIMAAMMQTLGGAVDAVSAANSRNNSAVTRPGNKRSIVSTGGLGQTGNVTGGSLIENFLTGTVKSTDQGMSIPTAGECFAQGRELWCDPSGIWESTPGITRWCLTNCRAINSNICDQNRCDCKCVNRETFRRNYERLSGNLV